MHTQIYRVIKLHVLTAWLGRYSFTSRYIFFFFFFFSFSNFLTAWWDRYSFTAYVKYVFTGGGSQE